MGMIVKDKSIKPIFRNVHMYDANKIAVTSVKFMDTTGWLIRALLQNSPNIEEVLSNLGKLHLRIGVKPKHFEVMLESLHETFTYYFPKNYKMQVRKKCIRKF